MSTSGCEMCEETKTELKAEQDTELQRKAGHMAGGKKQKADLKRGQDCCFPMTPSMGN